MTQIYPIQVIALDSTAHQAVEISELTEFTTVEKIELKDLAATAIKEHHQILVFSELTMPILNEIEYELSQMEDPIILFPKKEPKNEEIKRLILMGARIVFAPSDTIASFALSQTLKLFEIIFYGTNSDMEIVTDHKDVYEVIGRSTISEFYESDGYNSSTVMMSTINTPRGFSDVCGALALFEVSEAFPIIEIAEAMDVMEEILPEESGILFETRNTHTKDAYIKITCMLSRYVDFKNTLQIEINNAETYLDKVSVLVDAFYEGSVDYDGLHLLAIRNNIAEKDLNLIYTVAYVTPVETVKLMRLLRDETVSDQKKEEAVAVALTGTSIDSDLVEELVLTHALSVNNILVIKNHNNEKGEQNDKTQNRESSRETV